MYDPMATGCTTGPAPMPPPRASLVAGQSGDKVYSIGGTNGVSTSNANEVYDIPSNSWSPNTAMPTARQEAGVHSHGGRIYVVGGSTPASGASTDAHEGFKP